MPPPKLRRPPIIEVVLAFEVEYARPFSLEAARTFLTGLPGHGASADIGGGSSDDVPTGVMAYFDAARRAIQVGGYGLTINELLLNAPEEYTSWEAIWEEAEPLWNRFRSAFKIKRVQRLGLRYVNELTYPEDVTGTRRLLRSWPTVGRDLVTRAPQSYVMRMDVPTTRDHVNAVVTHVLSNEEEDGQRRVKLVIDNDVSFNHEVTPGDVWRTFELLRAVKNDLFYGSLTPAALKPYR